MCLRTPPLLAPELETEMIVRLTLTAVSLIALMASPLAAQQMTTQATPEDAVATGPEDMVETLAISHEIISPRDTRN